MEMNNDWPKRTNCEEIDDIYKSIESAYTLLGRNYYNRAKNLGMAEDMDIILEINALYEKIQKHERAMQNLANCKYCKYCKSEILENSEICSVCGENQNQIEFALLNEVERANEGDNKICKKCNTEYDIDQSFCAECGGALEVKELDFAKFIPLRIESDTGILEMSSLVGSVKNNGVNDLGKYCQSCNNKVGADDLFCERCGKKLNAEYPVTEKNKCVVCGTERELGDDFCVNCGNKYDK